MIATRIIFLCSWVIAGCHAAGAIAQLLTPTGKVALTGNFPEGKELSGITLARELMIVCPDEGVACYTLQKKDESTYDLANVISLHDDEDAELELEGVASDDKFVYLIGSHSLRRKTVDESRNYAENRKRMGKVESHDDSYRLFRLKLDSDGEVSSQKEIGLRELLEADPGAAPFIDVPSKENGIDIEGVAVKAGQLFIGFRGPVLREEYVPVVVLKFKDSASYELRFARLGGRGIRDITAVNDGFLIVGGPVGDGDGDFRVYHWDGKDCVPGDGSPGGKVRMLGRLPTKIGVNPEGIAVLSETNDAWEVLLVSDGDSSVQRFEISRD